MKSLLFLLSCFYLSISSCYSQDLPVRYAPLSKAYVKISTGTIYADTLQAFAETFTNIPVELSKSKVSDVRSNAQFKFSLGIDRSCIGQLYLNKTVYNIILIPNDTVDINLVSNSKNNYELTYNGRWTSINDYLYLKEKKLGYHDMRTPLNMQVTSNATYAIIRSATDSITNVELSFLKNNSSKLPQWFVDYEKAEIKYRSADFKIAALHYNETFKLFSDTPPPDYFSYLPTIEINNPKAILTNSYFMFLRSYFLLNIPKSTIDKLQGINRVIAIEKYAKPEYDKILKEPVKGLFHQYVFGSMISRVSKLSRIDSLKKVYEIKDMAPFEKYTTQVSNSQFKNLRNGEQTANFYLADLRDSSISIRDFANRIVYINFWATWCKPCLENIPNLNAMIDEYEKNDKVVIINICMDSKKDIWLKTISKHNLKGQNFFAQGNWVDKLKYEFNIQGFPQYVILNRENKLVERNTNKAPVVKSKIDELLKAR